MHHLFIINPAAGNKDRTEEYAENIRGICENHGVPCRIAVSKAPGDCARIARVAAESGEECRIYACGGDGTLNEVVRGVTGYSNVAVTHYAGGSGNDFVRMFSQPDAFRDLNRLMDPEETSFDVIRCNDSFALNVCSVGLDARIGTDIARYKRIPMLGGFRAYAASALVNIIKGLSEPYTVEIDGKTLNGEKTMICVCNGQYYGGGFHPVPTADPTDHILDVLIVEKVSRLKAASVIGKYKDGHFTDFPQYIHHIRTDKLTIHCEKPSSVNLDGELLVAKDVEISLIPGGVRFFYPKGLTWKQNACEKSLP